jgi:hypothetical protein
VRIAVSALESMSFFITDTYRTSMSIEELAFRHPLVADIVLCEAGKIGAEGKIRRIHNGKYIIMCDKAIIGSPTFPKSKTQNIEQKLSFARIMRARFTLAHELAHIILEEAPYEFRKLLHDENGNIPHIITERFCDECAAALLMPLIVLEEKLTDCSFRHPLEILLSISRDCMVNLQPLLLRLVSSRITKEHPWLIALLKYKYNPAKAGTKRWLLAPGTLLLPRGVGRAIKKVTLGEGMASPPTDPGYWNVGLDTLGFCTPDLAKSPDLEGILDYFEGFLAEATSDSGPTLPWADLNSPTSLKETKNRLRIRIEPSIDHPYLVAETLLDQEFEQRSQGRRGTEDEHWILAGRDVRAIGYKVEGSPPCLIIGAYLKVVPRVSPRV